MPKIIAAGVGLPLIGTGATVTTSQPLLNLTQTWNNAAAAFTGLKLNVTDTASASGSLLMDLQVGGSSQLTISKGGAVAATGGIRAGGGSGTTSAALSFYTGGLEMGSAAQIYWTNAGPSGTPDLVLRRDAANILALRNGTAGQAFNVYNTYTDASNHERGGLVWSGNDFYLATNNVGTGVARSLIFATNNLPRWRVEGSTGHFQAATDNTYDIGASGANRPRNIFVAGLGSFANYVAAAGIYPGGSLRSYINSGSDGTISLSNNAGTNSVQLTIGASNLLTLNGGLKTTGATFALQTATTLTDNAAAQVATMTNGPAAGNPTKWIAINDNGVTRYIPAW